MVVLLDNMFVAEDNNEDLQQQIDKLKNRMSDIDKKTEKINNQMLKQDKDIKQIKKKLDI